MPLVIGLSGKRQSGKDTLASALVAYHGFTRVAFADQLKAMLYVQNPYVGIGGGLSAGFVRLAALVDECGWDAAKQHDDVRQLLQRAGQWMFRVDKLFWVKAATRTMPADRPVVITDVRFSHEADWLRSIGGLLIRVERSGHVIADTDPSETEADSWDFDARVWNDGPGLTDPRAMALGLMHFLEG